MSAFVTPDKNKSSVLKSGRGEQTDSPIVESPKMTNIHAFINDQDLLKAEQMLNQTYQGLDYTQYSNWLGTKENRTVLREVLNLLRPWPKSLYLALSKLSSKLYLVAEATPLDNILEELAMQWTQEHQDTVNHYQGNFRICHIILFSLLILNSDLHNETFDYKFTKEQFIENTIFAVRYELKAVDLDELPIKKDLEGYYTQILEEPLPLCPCKTPKQNKTYPDNIINDRSSNPSSSSHRQSQLPLSRKSSVFSLRPGSFILERTTTTQSGVSDLSEWSHHVDAANFYVHEAQDEVQGKKNDSLWLVDHTINYKPQKNGTSQSDSPAPQQLSLFRLFKKGNNLKEQQKRVEHANKKMRKARVCIHKGCLELFSAKYKSKFTSRNFANPNNRSSNTVSHKFNLFGAFAEHIGETVIDCNGSSKPKCFQVLFSDDNPIKSMVFECANSQQCENYVQSINFWASRITPIPDSQFEMVSNQEYGWSDRLLNEYNENPSKFNLNKKVKVFPWEPLNGLESLLSDVNVSELGKLSMDSQLLNWKIFVSKLVDWINEHNGIKPIVIKIWTHSPNFELIMDNWNAKYLFLNRQHYKYSKYLKALENSYEQVN